MSTIVAPRAGTQAEAAALARNLLTRLYLPAGARRLPATPVPRSLREPALWGLATAVLDLHRLFELPVPMQSAAEVLAAHVPAGMTLASTGSGGGPAGTTSQDVSYQLRSVPAGVHAAQLALTVVPDSSGGSLVRADAQVIWYPPRPASEYIDPAHYHVVTITVAIGGGARPHTIRMVVTSPTVIATLADILDRSQVNPGRSISCPVAFAEYRLAFAVDQRSRPVVVASAARWPCEGVQIRIDGRLVPSLQDAFAITGAVNRLIGLTPGPRSLQGPAR